MSLRAGGIPAGLVGVGIDVEEVGGLNRFDEASALRAGLRWLQPGERSWCTAQRSFREAMVVVLSCKEAVYKSLPTHGAAHEVTLTMRGSTAAGWARSETFGPLRVEAVWQTSHDRIVALAFTAEGVKARRTGEQFLRHLLNALCLGAAPITRTASQLSKDHDGRQSRYDQIDQVPS